jgi:hypothetical protein
VISGAASALAWAALGFAGFAHYPSMLAALTRVESDRSYSLFALFLSAGASPTTARITLLVTAAALVAAIFVVSRSPGSDERSFCLALAASLLLSPIVWMHYLILLLIPIALSRPRLSPLWLAPFAFSFLDYSAHNQGSIARILIAFGILVGVFVRSNPRRERVPVFRAAEPIHAEAA